ncbi:TonB family protein [Spirosoma arcticum]
MYPHPSARNPREGTVLVRFRVMATGELTQIRLVHSSDSGLDQTAL